MSAINVTTNRTDCDDIQVMVAIDVRHFAKVANDIEARIVGFKRTEGTPSSYVVPTSVFVLQPTRAGQYIDVTITVDIFDEKASARSKRYGGSKIPVAVIGIPRNPMTESEQILIAIPVNSRGPDDELFRTLPH